MGTRWLWAALPFVLVLVLAEHAAAAGFRRLRISPASPEGVLRARKDRLSAPQRVRQHADGRGNVEPVGDVDRRRLVVGALAGKLVTVVFTPLCALGLLAAGRRFYSTAAGVVAALLYLSVPWILSVSSQGLIDGVLACYLFLALYAVLLWKQGVGSGGCCLLLGGYLAGAAAATKYPGILFVLVPLAGWVLRGRRAGEGERERAHQNLKSQISNLKSQISNLKSQISNLKSRSVVLWSPTGKLKPRLAPLALAVFYSRPQRAAGSGLPRVGP